MAPDAATANLPGQAEARSTADTGGEQPAGPEGFQRLAEVVPLHARELASSSLEESSEQVVSFAGLVRSLEVADGRPLHGAGRSDCERAYEAHPAGFAAAVDEAGAANVQRRCGLLVKLVRDGWHVAADELAHAKHVEPDENALLKQRMAERAT